MQWNLSCLCGRLITREFIVLGLVKFTSFFLPVESDIFIFDYFLCHTQNCLANCTESITQFFHKEILVLTEISDYFFKFNTNFLTTHNHDSVQFRSDPSKVSSQTTEKTWSLMFLQNSRQNTQHNSATEELKMQNEHMKKSVQMTKMLVSCSSSRSLVLSRSINTASTTESHNINILASLRAELSCCLVRFTSLLLNIILYHTFVQEYLCYLKIFSYLHISREIILDSLTTDSDFFFPSHKKKASFFSVFKYSILLRLAPSNLTLHVHPDRPKNPDSDTHRTTDSMGRDNIASKWEWTSRATRCNMKLIFIRHKIVETRKKWNQFTESRFQSMFQNEKFDFTECRSSIESIKVASLSVMHELWFSTWI